MNDCHIHVAFLDYSPLPASFSLYGLPRVTLDCDPPTVVPPAATEAMCMAVANIHGTVLQYVPVDCQGLPIPAAYHALS